MSKENEQAAAGEAIADCAPETVSCEDCPNDTFCEEMAQGEVEGER